MKTFQDLYIHLNGFDMEALADLFTKQCNEFWTRAIDREKDADVPNDQTFWYEEDLTN